MGRIGTSLRDMSFLKRGTMMKLRRHSQSSRVSDFGRSIGYRSQYDFAWRERRDRWRREETDC